MTSHVAAKVGVKQETIAIVAVGLTILGTMLFTTTRLEARIDRIQAEARADREAFLQRTDRLHAEAQADREAFTQRMDLMQAEFRAEAKSDRDAFSREIDRIRAEARTDRETFAREILRLTAGQARLAGIVEGPRPE